MTRKIYKVVNGERTAKVDAPSPAQATAQFLKIDIRRVFECSGNNESFFFGVCDEHNNETDERVAVFV